MDGKLILKAPPNQTTDLLGDVSSQELTRDNLSSVKKEWEHRKAVENKGYRPILVLTSKDRIKTTRPPRGISRFDKVLSALRPPFQKVFHLGQNVVAIDTDTGRHILSGGHLANASLSQKGYCVALAPSATDAKTIKTKEFQLLSTSFFFSHKKRERQELVKEWVTYHLIVFKEDDITRHLSYLFNVTERTIYKDLNELSHHV